MAANVLKSARATAMSVEVVRAFVSLRRMASSHQKIGQILRALEAAVRGRLDRHDKQIAALFDMMATLIDDETVAGKKHIGTA